MICSQCNKEFILLQSAQKYCSKKCTKIVLAENRRKYQQSEKGKATERKYQQSTKYKKYKKKLDQTEKSKNRRKEYEQSKEGKAAKRRYLKSTSYKEYKKIYNNLVSTKKKVQKNAKKRRETDPLFKLKAYVRSRINDFLKVRNMRKSNGTFVIIGCTPEFLKNYLEKKFKPGMSWQNHTKTGWHIDHIIPLASSKTPEETLKLMHYTNLQPLWAIDNMKKGGRY